MRSKQNHVLVTTACGIGQPEEVFLGEYIVRFDSPMARGPSSGSIECSWRFETKQFHRINMVIEKFKSDSRCDSSYTAT